MDFVVGVVVASVSEHFIARKIEVNDDIGDGTYCSLGCHGLEYPLESNGSVFRCRFFFKLGEYIELATLHEDSRSYPMRCDECFSSVGLFNMERMEMTIVR